MPLAFGVSSELSFAQTARSSAVYRANEPFCGQEGRLHHDLQNRALRVVHPGAQASVNLLLLHWVASDSTSRTRIVQSIILCVGYDRYNAVYSHSLAARLVHIPAEVNTDNLLRRLQNYIVMGNCLVPRSNEAASRPNESEVRTVSTSFNPGDPVFLYTGDHQSTAAPRPYEDLLCRF